MKIHFWPKTEKKRKWSNSPLSTPKTKASFGRLLVWWLDLSDPDPLRFYDRSTPLHGVNYIRQPRNVLTAPSSPAVPGLAPNRHCGVWTTRRRGFAALRLRLRHMSTDDLTSNCSTAKYDAFLKCRTGIANQSSVSVKLPVHNATITQTLP